MRGRMSLFAWSAVVVTALSSSFAVVTSASPQFTVTAQVNYFSQKPGTSSGFQTLITWSDPTMSPCPWNDIQAPRGW